MIFKKDLILYRIFSIIYSNWVKSCLRSILCKCFFIGFSVWILPIFLVKNLQLNIYGACVIGSPSFLKKDVLMPGWLVPDLLVLIVLLAFVIGFPKVAPLRKGMKFWNSGDWIRICLLLRLLLYSFCGICQHHF